MATAKQPASIDDIEFDVLISHSKTLEATVPTYPTEDGYSVTDSIIVGAKAIEATVFITDTPVTWKSRFGGRTAISVIEALEELFFERKLVTFRTMDCTYTDMAITSITIPKTAEAGNSYEISIRLQEVTVTTATTVTISDSYSRGGETGTNAGTASTSATSSGSAGSSAEDSAAEGESSASILYGIASTAGLF